MTVAGPRPVEAIDAVAIAPAAPHTRWDRRLALIVLVITIGYLVFGRTFAYIGIASVNLFLGEMLLVLLLLAPSTRGMYLAAVRGLVRPGMWHLLVIAVMLMLLYGLAQAVRGRLLGLDTLYALKNLPYNYYPLFLFAGLWLGRTYPDALRRATLWLAWINGVYGTAYVLVLSELPWLFPGQERVPLLGISNAAGLAIIGLLAFHLHRRSTPLLVVLNAFVMLGIQHRSEWVGFACALLIWCLLTRRIKAFAMATGGVLGLLTVVSAFGLTIPGASTRGGEISLGGVIGRTIAPLNPELAARFLSDTGSLGMYSGTVSWRTTWWSAIWEQSTSSPLVAVLGNGYGYELRQLAPYVPEETRTPHNVFFYALGYTGWLGVLLTVVLWVVLGRLLWLVHKRTGQPYGIAVAVFTFGLGMFGNWFETPFGALPTYVLLGVCLAPLLEAAPVQGPAGGRRPWELRPPAPRRAEPMRT